MCIRDRLAALADRFDPAWLAGYRTVIIDGLHHASELQARALRTLTSHADCTLIVDAASLDAIRNAGEYHPLRLVKEFLATIGASVGEASGSGDAGGRFLAEALFSDRSFDHVASSAPAPDAFDRDLRLVSAVNTREEVSWIAGEVKRSLRNGIAPDSILVAFPPSTSTDRSSKRFSATSASPLTGRWDVSSVPRRWQPR